MTKRRGLALAPHDHVVTAWAEHAAGPGWANNPVWVLVRDGRDGSHRVDCLQPDEQTAGMLTLYRVSEAAHLALTAEVRATARRAKGEETR